MGKPNARSGMRWVVRGRVQGVGFRQFVLNRAVEIGLTGHVRNLSDGSVEVYACGTRAELDTLAGHLARGPRFSDVRGVEAEEAAPQAGDRFVVRY